ncbi:MAG: hypothetical protein LBK56_08845 [Gracilibacteraceae bacterium]|nr:hypothetical protein [Gracilibacteraceae bacterium]
MKKGGGTGGSKAKSQKELFGKEYTDVKGHDTIQRLRKEKQGYVKGAFDHPDIGPNTIDLFWGDDSVGLCHMISERRTRGVNIDAFLKELPLAVEKGKLGPNHDEPDTRINIYHRDKVVVITYELRGEEARAILTAYKTTKLKNSAKSGGAGTNLI